MKLREIEEKIGALRETISNHKKELSELFDKRERILKVGSKPKFEAFLKETDPKKIDWDFVYDDNGAALFDYGKTNKKVADLFGAKYEHFVKKVRYNNWKSGTEYRTFELALNYTSLETFKNVINFMSKSWDTLGDAGNDYGDRDLSEYIKIAIFDDDLCENGIPNVFFKKDMSSFLFAVTRYSSFSVKKEFESLDELIEWMFENGRTYS